MKVYLVVDINNSPGRVLAVFADEEDAERFVGLAGALAARRRLCHGLEG